MLTIRAGGTLDIQGSITDGFFNFHDQTDPDYLNKMLGGGNKIYDPYLVTGCTGNGCGDVGAWGMGDDLPTSYVLVRIPGKNDLTGQLFNPAPYTAAANGRTRQASAIRSAVPSSSRFSPGPTAKLRS